MLRPVPTRANILGDLRAEYDKQMLEKAFYTSPDYRSIIEAGDRAVIVGRRGTGKSALLFRLSQYWGSAQHTRVVSIAPEDYETIGMRGVLSKFDVRFNLVRAAAKLVWHYGLTMEVCATLSQHFKFRTVTEIPHLIEHLREWRRSPASVSQKIRLKLEQIASNGRSPEALVGDLAQHLQLNHLDLELRRVLDLVGDQVYVLIDRLDEGYEPDVLGVGLIDGFVHASIEINKTFPKVKAFVFLRDNIFRAISKQDADFSRQIEGQVLRLHWDEYHLLNMIANRLRVAFDLQKEQSIAVWDDATCGEISDRNGFRKCLRLTLYRPRDLLVLLNNAFYLAFQHGRRIIAEEDIEASANDISNTRCTDLLKEYEAIFPGLERLTRAFSDGPSEWDMPKIRQLIDSVFASVTLQPSEAQHFAILSTADAAVGALYSVGFLGVRDSISGRFKFCHDGNQVPLELSDASKLLVHPCYWRALNVSAGALEPDTAAEIHDEYDIEVSSETPEIRKHRIGQIISALGQIPLGETGARDFEQWCHQAIGILFAAGLRNIELKPNKNATQRRDIVARNQEGTPTWRDILTDYHCRQVLFEVKNYAELGPAEYRQMSTYLCRDYGALGFIITRDEDEAVRKTKELPWVREIFHEHKKLVVKLTGVWLAKYLSKARNPQKHDAADIALAGLLDRYARNYLSLGQ